MRTLTCMHIRTCTYMLACTRIHLQMRLRAMRIITQNVYYVHCIDILYFSVPLTRNAYYNTKLYIHIRYIYACMYTRALLVCYAFWECTHSRAYALVCTCLQLVIHTRLQLVYILAYSSCTYSLTAREVRYPFGVIFC